MKITLAKINIFLFMLYILCSYGYAQEKTGLVMEADKASLDENGWIVAEGHVKITYEGTVIEADQAEVQKDERIVRAFGNVYLNNQGDQAQGELLTYNLREKEGELLRGKGKAKNFKMGGTGASDYIYYRGEETDIRPSNLFVGEGEFSTCDLPYPNEHYHMDAKTINVEAGDKMVARSVSVYYKGHKIFWFPFVIVSLKETARQDFLPRIGYNQYEGFFVKQMFNYYINTNHYGTTNIDYASNLGVSWGFTHNYRIGATATGAVSYLRQSGQNNVGSNQLSFRHSQNFTQNLSGTFSFTTTNNTGIQLVTNPNINSSVSLAYRGESFNTNFSTNYFKGSSLNTDVSYNLQHSQTFFGKLSTDIQINSVNDAGPGTDDRNQTKFLITGRSPLGPVNLNFTVDYTGSNFTQYFTQKMPEVTLTNSNPIKIGNITLPFTGSFSYGYYNEESTSTKMSRGDLKVNYNQTFNFAENHSLSITSYLDQTFYSSGEARYILNTNINLSNAIANHFRSQLNLSSNIPNGFSPFSFDGVGSSYHSLTYQMEVFDESKWRFSLDTGYNITDETFNPIVTRFNFRPRDDLIFDFGFAYDLNLHQAQTFDTHLDLQVHPEWRVEYASSYNFYSNEFGNQDFKVTKDCHCWMWSVVYRTYTNEFLLQVAIKAFPSQSFQIGASPQVPILPILQNIQNQVSNPNFQF